MCAPVVFAQNIGFKFSFSCLSWNSCLSKPAKRRWRTHACSVLRDVVVSMRDPILHALMIGEKQKRRWSEISDDELEQEEKYLLAMVP